MKIYRFEDFVSKEDQSLILEFYKNNPKWKPIPGEKKFSSQQKNMLISNEDNSHIAGSKEVFDILDKYSYKIAELLHKEKIIENHIFVMPPTLFKYSKGYSLLAHMDTRYSKWISHASVLYFNDDYSGGELSFPLLNISIRPKARELILFSQEDKEYLHEVKIITDGIRYSSATWWGSEEAVEDNVTGFHFE
jgi:hypothetical protein